MNGLVVRFCLFEDYFRDTCGISKKNMIAFLQENSLYSLKESIGECKSNVHLFVGEKENHTMKKSSIIIREKLQNSFLEVLPGMHHGEFSINQANDYVNKILEILTKDRDNLHVS